MSITQRLSQRRRHHHCGRGRPIKLLQAAEGGTALAEKTLVYPPALTGLRGNHPGSFEPAHSIARDGKQYDFANIPSRANTIW